MPRITSFFLLLLCAPLVVGQDVAHTAETLIKQAEVAYSAKNFSQSAALQIRALPLVDEVERAGVEYNIACSQSLAGDKVSALDTLDRAVEDGYSNRKGTEADQDLVPLHTDPRWQPMLVRMENVIKQQDARWGDAAFASAYSLNISDADKLAGLSELWAQAKYGFANFWHIPQLKWDETYREFIPEVLATRSTNDYYRVLQRFYAQLEDGHTGVYTPEEVEGKVSRLALRTRLVDGHLLVVGSRGSLDDLQGIHLGDEVLKINDEAALEWAKRNVGPFVSASTPQDRDARIYEYVPFLAPVGTPFTLLTQTPSGQSATHVFKVTDLDSAHIPLFALHILPGNIAYVALNGFDDDTAAKEWDKQWPTISGAKAIILDLRENGGGSDSVGSHILSTLIGKPAQGNLSRSTRWIATYRAWGDAETPIRFPVGTVEPDPVHQFSGPVVLLTSPRTYSAGEDMVVVFTQAHRGKVVGEPTGGSTGQPLMFKLPGGGVARVCTKHDSFADGREFVGIGIQPDIPAHLTRADIIAGRDSVLDVAVRSLQTKQ